MSSRKYVESSPPIVLTFDHSPTDAELQVYQAGEQRDPVLSNFPNTKPSKKLNVAKRK